MSEGLLHINVPQQISDLAALAGTSCEGFAHRIYNSRIAFAGPGPLEVISIQVPENSALIIVGIDVKTLYNTADAALVGDFRSTDDLNPFGPYVGTGAVGQVQLFFDGEQYCATAFDIGVINAGILLIVDSQRIFTVTIDPLQPAGKPLTLVSRVNAYTIPQGAAEDLKKKQTQFLDATP